MEALVEGGSGGWRNIGLFTGLSTGSRDWAYYYLNVAGDPDAARATVTYDDGLHPLQTVDLGPVQMPAKYILRIQWDGEKMSFLVNGRPYLTSIEYPGYTDTFGIHWAVGSGSTFKGAVDNFIVEWK